MRTLICLSLICGIWPGAAISEPLDNDCECPKLSCNTECEYEKDVKFYSEKCAAGERVKSCARPSCVPLENAPASCALPKGAAANVNNAKDTAAPAPARTVASEKDAKSVVGQVSFLEGKVQIFRGGGSSVNANVGDEVREKDRIVTAEKSRLQIKFNSGNFLNITPKSEVVIQEVNDVSSEQEKKRVVLDLIKGQIRNRVNQKYNGEQSYYRVRAAGAVAGVRGTDFVVTMSEDAKDVTSKIDTFEGKVELSDQAFEKKVLIAKHETASFIASKDSLKASNDQAEFVAKGRFTQVEKMTAGDSELLDKETRFAFMDSGPGEAVVASQDVKKSDAPICEAPEGTLNQCSWTCENNPGGEKRCRTDLHNVSCVRRICNANGQWSSPTRLPASYHDACGAHRPVVKSCDY